MSPLSPPPPAGELQGFPAYSLSLLTPYYRIHQPSRGPWNFSGRKGRFDLPHPLGTCHLAETPTGAFIEVFRFANPIPEDEISKRRLSTLVLPDASLPVADCTEGRARGFGVTAELHSTPDYGLPREWAVAFRQAGFAGVRHRLSHDPEQQEIGIALFGRVTDTSSFAVANTEPIPPAVIADARTRFGLIVLPAPRMMGLS